MPDDIIKDESVLEDQDADLNDLSPDLDILTGDEFQVPYISVKFSSYKMEEDELPEETKLMLHGRAFVVDNDIITSDSSGSPQTYYIASDKVNGLIIPGRSLSIDNEGPEEIYYRWTDDGDKWTSWITLNEGETHDYDTYEKCRFAEVQVYVLLSGARVSIRATR